MIRWCIYCQQFIGEKEPYLDYSITHGICTRCFEAEAFWGETPSHWKLLREFYAKLTRSAYQGDLDSAEKLAREAIASGFDLIDVALGFIQPALYEIGAKWARGEITHQDEHRFTTWSDRWLEIAGAEGSPQKKHPDLLITQAPGNLHVLGPHLASLALRKSHYDVRHERQALTVGDLLDMVGRLKPVAVGFSCALPAMVDPALVLAQELRQTDFRGQLLLGGIACRGPSRPAAPAWVRVVRNLTEVVEILSSA